MNFINKNVFETLKSILKKKSITYAELADRLQMSEAGIKKIMMQQDCNISKLNEICDAIEFGVHELWSLSEVTKQQPIKFNENQEQEFLKDESLYFYFRALVNLEFDVSRVKEKFSLSDRQSFSYLKKLDEMSLIELHKDNQIKSKIKKHTYFANTPKLGNMNSNFIYGKFFEYTRNKFLHEMQDRYLGAFSVFMLKEDSVVELKKALMDVFDEFHRRSKREKVLYDKNDLIKVTNLNLLADGFDEMDHYPLGKNV